MTTLTARIPGYLGLPELASLSCILGFHELPRLPGLFVIQWRRSVFTQGVGSRGSSGIRGIGIGSRRWLILRGLIRL